MMPGNDDIADMDGVLDEPNRIVNFDRKIVDDDGHEVLSLGVANPSPFGCPRDPPESEIESELEALAAQPKDVERAIFNVHVPPYQTGLDDAPKRDKDLRPSVGLTGVDMLPVGSKAVPESLLSHQQMLALHGHINESRGVKRLGCTTCVKPGSEYSDGILSRRHHQDRRRSRRLTHAHLGVEPPVGRVPGPPKEAR